jgi:putative oxidoreductase
MKEKLTDFGLLWLRVAVGCGLIVHGWLKLQGGIETFASHGIEPLGFPQPLVFAWLAVSSEILGGFFLTLGLWTRLAAAAVTVTMFVAAFGAGAGQPVIAAGKGSRELALCYLVMAVTILFLGPGKYAVSGGKKSRGSGKKRK